MPAGCCILFINRFIYGIHGNYIMDKKSTDQIFVLSYLLYILEKVFISQQTFKEQIKISIKIQINNSRKAEKIQNRYLKLNKLYCYKTCEI